ncbi:MliC family protein [Colwellia sp. 20A7]|uniref:MliC family protein n=1 Tax=Colwellia sp. 20A7 TaxID=2689569 RepID=UPI00135C0DE8|nr:MliC family protein [Colwellia sp. 20A7]
MKQTFVITTLLILCCACSSNTTVLPVDITTKPYLFSCEDKGLIKALYSKGGIEATLDISFPKLGINKKTLHFHQAISASGARYINKSNSNITYEWHTKADYGHISMLSGANKNFSISCQLQ